MKFATHSSLSFWRSLLAPERARTLALNRFADFPLELQNGFYLVDRSNTAYRRETCEAVAGGDALRDGGSAWLHFVREELRLADDELLFGQLQSRLMVNMAGGVLENGGLCLDRRTGLPIIPGSAVKGCARRMAIEDLHQAAEDKKPVGELAALVADIARVFGWGEQDWKTRDEIVKLLKEAYGETDADLEARKQQLWKEKRSDLAFACGKRWTEVQREVRQCLNDVPKDFAGAVSFLPAWPAKVTAENLPAGTPPEIGKLESDVLTCHHRKYYDGKDPAYVTAPDTEEPNPVVFPVVAPGHVFVFAVRPLRSQWSALSQPEKTLVEIAREWLRKGLGTFGLGAKTAAGYGWFDTSPEFNATLREQEKQKAEAETQRLQVELEAESAKARIAAEKAAIQAKRATLAPDLAWQKKFQALREPDRRAIINLFAFDDEIFWPTKGELADETIQFSLLHLLLKVEPDFLTADRANPKSKLAKALSGLKRKYPVLA